MAALIPEPVQQYPMVPVTDDLYLVEEPQTLTWIPVTFYQPPTR
jgi:hypothetical protein